MVSPTREWNAMDESKEARRMIGAFSDLRINPRILAAFVYNQITEDVAIRLHQFMTSLIHLWAGDGNVPTNKTAHIYKWARKADNV